MQGAPAVLVRIGASRVWRIAQALLGAIAGGWTAHWAGSWWTAASASGDPWPSSLGQGAWTLPWLLLFSAICAAVGGFVSWRTSFQDEIDLSWDGLTWQFRCLTPPWAQPKPQQLTNEFRPCRPSVAWDFGAALLLRLDSEPGRVGTRMWLMCERARLGGAWHPLRLALFASSR